MYWDVKLVKPLSGYRIYVEIENQQKGVFDLKPYLDKGVFRELQNIHYFNQVGILFGAAQGRQNKTRRSAYSRSSNTCGYWCAIRIGSHSRVCVTFT